MILPLGDDEVHVKDGHVGSHARIALAQIVELQERDAAVRRRIGIVLRALIRRIVKLHTAA